MKKWKKISFCCGSLLLVPTIILPVVISCAGLDEVNAELKRISPQGNYFGKFNSIFNYQIKKNKAGKDNAYFSNIDKIKDPNEAIAIIQNVTVENNKFELSRNIPTLTYSNADGIQWQCTLKTFDISKETTYLFDDGVKNEGVFLCPILDKNLVTGTQIKIKIALKNLKTKAENTRSFVIDEK